MIRRILKEAYNAFPAKKQIFAALRGLSVPEKLYRHLHFQGQFTVELPGGGAFKMMHFGSQVENDLFWAGFGNNWERTSLRVWEALARKAQTVLDIGANTGTFALAAQAANPSAHIEAFEPVARVFDKLSRNAQINGGRIAVNCLALSDHNGSATLFDSGDAHVYSASLNSEMLGDAGRRAEHIIPVQTLDSFCSEHSLSNIGLIKIDTEMHEPEVLAGAQEILERDQPAVLIEILNAELGQKAISLMKDYRFFEVGEGTGLTASVTPGAAGERNYLALHKSDPRVNSIGASMSEANLAALL